MGRKGIASKRKLKPPVKFVSCSPTSSRIHMNCQQERKQERHGNDSSLLSQTPLFTRRWERPSNRSFTLNLLLSTQADVRAVQNLALHSTMGSFSIQTTKCLSLLITNLQLQNSSEKQKECTTSKFTKFHSHSC